MSKKELKQRRPSLQLTDCYYQSDECMMRNAKALSELLEATIRKVVKSIEDLRPQSDIRGLISYEFSSIDEKAPKCKGFGKFYREHPVPVKPSFCYGMPFHYQFDDGIVVRVVINAFVVDCCMRPDAEKPRNLAMSIINRAMISIMNDYTLEHDYAAMRETAKSLLGSFREDGFYLREVCERWDGYGLDSKPLLDALIDLMSAGILFTDKSVSSSMPLVSESALYRFK